MIDAVIVNIVPGLVPTLTFAGRSPRMEELSFADAQDRVRVAMEADWEADGFGEF